MPYGSWIRPLCLWCLLVIYKWKENNSMVHGLFSFQHLFVCKCLKDIKEMLNIWQYQNMLNIHNLPQRRITYYAYFDERYTADRVANCSGVANLISCGCLFFLSRTNNFQNCAKKQISMPANLFLFATVQANDNHSQI